MRTELRTFRFRWLLTVVVMWLLVLSMGLVGVASFYFGERTVDELAGTIVRQTVLGVGLRLESFMRDARDQNSHAVRLSAGPPLRAADFPRLAASLLPTFESHARLNRIYFGLAGTGEFFTLEREDNGDLRFREQVDGEGRRRVERIHHRDGDAWVLTVARDWDGYDPRQRPYFARAAAARTSVWTGTYSFWRRPEDRRPKMGLTFATPVYDAAGELLGVWGSDLDVDSLCEFVRSLQSQTPGTVFLLEEKPEGGCRIIAHPDADLIRDSATGDLLESAGRVREATLRAALARVPARFADMAGRGLHQFSFATGGEAFLGCLRITEDDPFTAVAMILPTRDVTGNARLYAVAYGAILATVLAAAIATIVWVSRRATHRLHELSREAEEISRLDFSPPPERPSRIREMRELAEALGRLKANLRSFRKYVPADIVAELVRTGREATLGGAKVTATIYFSDITDFTGTAEKCDPEALVRHLGEYLSAMTEGIAAHGGTVDKFIGDAVMAFWNAPQPNPRHAFDACRAALWNQRRLASLRPKWEAAGQPLFHTRMALHTGPLVVGNIGSEQRMNYTVIGDSVNLASRLEELNKRYRTQIIISEATFVEVRQAVVARPLDRVNVQGKSGGVTLYELLALKGEAAAGETAHCTQTGDAFACYQAREFAEAARRYAEIVRQFPDDAAAKLLLERCTRFASKPPGPMWNGTVPAGG